MCVHIHTDTDMYIYIYIYRYIYMYIYTYIYIHTHILPCAHTARQRWRLGTEGAGQSPGRSAPTHPEIFFFVITYVLYIYSIMIYIL